MNNNNLTRLGSLQTSVPLCPDVIPLGMKTAGLEEPGSWTGMNTEGEAGRVFTWNTEHFLSQSHNQKKKSLLT